MEGRRFDSIWNALYPDSMVCASSMELKSILFNEITEVLNNNGWNSQEAASSMGMPRGVFNNILEGNIDNITIDDLLLIMEKAGRPGTTFLRGNTMNCRACYARARDGSEATLDRQGLAWRGPWQRPKDLTL